MRAVPSSLHALFVLRKSNEGRMTEGRLAGKPTFYGHGDEADTISLQAFFACSSSCVLTQRLYKVGHIVADEMVRVGTWFEKVRNASA